MFTGIMSECPAFRDWLFTFGSQSILGAAVKKIFRFLSLKIFHSRQTKTLEFKEIKDQFRTLLILDKEKSTDQSFSKS